MYSHTASHAPLISRLLSVCFTMRYFFLSTLFFFNHLKYEIKCIIKKFCLSVKSKISSNSILPIQLLAPDTVTGYFFDITISLFLQKKLY